MESLSFIDQMYQKERKQTGFTKHYYTLFAIVEGLEAKKTFEFGTGMSTKVIVEALKRTGGSHISCDMRDLVDTGLTPSYYVDNADRWEYIQKNSNLISADELKSKGPFDFVLHDGSHIPGEVMKDLRKIIPCMKKNSILLIHDTEDGDKSYYSGMKMAVLKETKDVFGTEMLTLPYGYGLTICRILHDFGNGIVSPTWRKS